MSILTLDGVSVSLAGRPILRGVDLSVESGDFLALLGPNGSGKSTLIKAVTGLNPVSAGSLRLFDTDQRDFRTWSRIGYVPQRSSAASGVPASVREVVASGRLPRRRIGRPLSRRDREVIEEVLSIVGLADRAQESVSNLSGGQQQRVLIARALAGEPDLLLLDEPTAGVDLPHQEQLAGCLGVLKGLGATVVLVTHELGPMAPLITRAVVLRDGRVAYDGGPLTDAQVHQPEFGAGDLHAHHHPEPVLPDITPGVSAPLDHWKEQR